MGTTFDRLDDALCAWLEQQRLFFVATAPTDPHGHVNLSPKGCMDTFRVLNPQTIAYLDLHGSGVETVAHLHENGRIVVMFCAFEGAPRILRLHGRGRVVRQDDPTFADLLARFQPSETVRSALRSIVVIDVHRIGDSCGFVVPRMDYVGERQQLFRWVEHQRAQGGDEQLEDYVRQNNATSIDGLPGLASARTPPERGHRASK